jgi:hypothetical protein
VAEGPVGSRRIVQRDEQAGELQGLAFISAAAHVDVFSASGNAFL